MTPIPIEGDLNETEAWSGFVGLRAGSHVIECVSAEEAKTKKKGHPQIILELEAVAGDEAGASIRDYIVVIPSTYGKVRQVLEAFGLPLPSEGGSVDAKVFLNKRAKIIVRPEEKHDDPGQTVERVQGYSALTGAEELTSKLKENFDATPVGDDDKDIPF